MCNKVCYDKIGASLALINIKQRRIRSKGKRQEYRMYYCKECRAWHLSSTPQLRVK